MYPRRSLCWPMALLGILWCIGQLAAVFAQERPYNPPEFYQRVREKRIRILKEQKRTIDLSNHPRYRIAVNDRENTIRVEKATYWFEVNKKNGVVDRVQLLDVSADKECAFGALEVTDATGKVYRQSVCQADSLEVEEENLYLYWKVRFSPADSNGKTLPVKIEGVYQLFKMSGLVKVHYRVVEGSAEIKQLVVRNSPGRLPVKLDIAYSAFFFDNDGAINDTLNVRVADTDSRVIAAGKVVAPIWTDGRIGFHTAAMRQTWYQMEPMDARSELKRSVVHTIDGKRHLDFYFVNTEKSTVLESGREMECGFAFLPFQRYQPRLPLVGTTNAQAANEYIKKGDITEVVRDLRRAFWAGSVRGNGLGTATWPPLMNACIQEPFYERAKRLHKIWQEVGMFPSGGNLVNAWTGVPGYDLGGPLEEGLATPEFLAAWKREGFTSLSTPEFRDWIYDIRVSQLEAHGFKLFYEDLHAHIDVGKNFDSQVEGEVRYLEDIVLLHSAYGGERMNVAHAGNILTVADSVNDATWPGEPWTGQFFKELPLATLDVLLNPFLVGTDVCFYGENDIYDFRSLRMCKQMLRNAVVPYYGAVLKTFGGGLVRPYEIRSELAESNWNRYFVPSRTFRTDRSRFVSWRDPEVADYFATADPDHKVNLYHRDGEAYVTCVELGEAAFQPSLKFNVGRLGFAGQEAFVFDLLPRRLSIVPVRDGWVEYLPVKSTHEPVLIYLKDKLNDEPTVIWKSFTIDLERVRDPSIPDAEVRWKCRIPMLPLETKEELIRVYVGQRGRPRSYHPWGICRVEESFPEQQSLDLAYRIRAATDDGPIGAEEEFHLRWDKAFQLSFPYLGDESAVRLEKQESELKYSELVARLTDLERLAVLPAVGETCAQASSYDRAAHYDSETGKYVEWNANVDNGQTISRKEGEQIVMADIKGPGCIWRSWTANPKEGHFRFFFNGAEEPALDLPFRQFFDGTDPDWPPLSDKLIAPYPPEEFTLPFGPEPLGVRGRAKGSALYHCAARGWNSYVPIPFQKSLKILADPWKPPYNHEGLGMFFQFTYGTFPPGTRVPTFVTENDG